MGQALYRKYRSKSLAEIVGQEHITDALARALKEGHISHAYLLTGPRGVGKTSIARILAHEINALPYNDETMHLDIIEIDAASNNGVEDVRDLREKVLLAPTQAKFKVYIIDEVHMLSSAAFNALLKTLEEPPAHAVFILATTEVHKLPATIISRTQRFQFQPVTEEKVIAHLQAIAVKENIAIDKEALQLIATHGDGAFRDSISLLDQLRSVGNGTITAADVEATLGVAPRAALEQLLDTASSGDVHSTTTLYNAIVGKGVNAAALASQLMNLVRLRAATQPALYTLIDKLIEVPRAYNPRLKLEVVIATFALEQSNHRPSPSPQDTTTPPPAPKTVPPAAKTPSTPPPPAPKALADATAPQQQPATPPIETAEHVAQPPAASTDPSTPLHDITDEQWQQVVDTAKNCGATLYTVLRQAMPHFDPEKQLLTITFRFPLHQKRFEEAKHKQEFIKVLATVLGGVPELQVVLNKNAVRHIAPAASAEQEITDALPADPEAHNVIGLMGGGEVVNV